LAIESQSSGTPSRPDVLVPRRVVGTPPPVGKDDAGAPSSALEGPGFGGVLIGLGTVLSLGWLGLCAWYVDAELGWALPGTMLPHELGAVVAGAVTPLVLLWVALGYWVRGRDSLRHARQIERRLKEFLDPPGGTDRINTMTEAMRTQARELAAASHQACEEAEAVKNSLDERAKSLMRITDLAASHTGRMREALENHLKEAPTKIEDSYKISENELRHHASNLEEIKSEENQLKALFKIARDKGPINAFEVVKKMKDFHLFDRFHDEFIERFDEFPK